MSLLFQGAKETVKGTGKAVEGITGLLSGVFGVLSVPFKATSQTLHKLVGGAKPRKFSPKRKSPRKKSPRKKLSPFYNVHGTVYLNGRKLDASEMYEKYNIDKFKEKVLHFYKKCKSKSFYYRPGSGSECELLFHVLPKCNFASHVFVVDSENFEIVWTKLRKTIPGSNPTLDVEHEYKL